MMRTKLWIVLLTTFLASTGPTWAAALDDVRPEQEGGREPLLEGLGPHRRVVTTPSPEAQRYFDQGLALLYAFNHDEAARSFRQAAEIDPGCAMAWWGVAMAHGPHINNPLLAGEKAQAAREAIEKARACAAGAAPVERALIEAAAKRYEDTGQDDRKALDEAYAAAMEQVWRAHPSDPDVGALYAEALMDLRPWDLWMRDGSPQPGTDKVLAMLEKVLEIQPDHPLACHLYIHAVEASPNPEKAIQAADRLRTLAPGLPHLVHMPSHIDVRLGNWKKAIEANGMAIAADRAYREIRPRQGFYRLYMLHDQHMLAYAALMRGESRRAIRTIDEMIAEMPIEWARENVAIADGYIAMPLEVRMRFGRWDEILAAPEPESTFPLARSLRLAARGVALAAKGQVEQARHEQEAFLAARGHVAEDARFGNSTAHGILDVAEHLLAGEILYREGQHDAAFAELHKAVAAEDALNYDEPPDWIQPVRHALGAALLDANRPAEAEAVYREDLRRLPDNGWSLFGLAQSLERQGKHDEAATVRARWREVWKDADIELSSSCFCLPGT
jgi:tetratricopeptide (TPR) repeat protein